MPKLNCGVSNCAHNAESSCCLGKIDVAGSSAHSSEATNCNNFLEGNGATNAMESPQAFSDVQCQATDCAHNENSCCKAESIQVAGAGATNCDDTQCSSFCQR